MIPFVDEASRSVNQVHDKRQAERRAGGTVSPVAGTTSVLAAGGGHTVAVVPWAAACEISEARSSISVTRTGVAATQ